jgi:hypothetical protein
MYDYDFAAPSRGGTLTGMTTRSLDVERGDERTGEGGRRRRRRARTNGQKGNEAIVNKHRTEPTGEVRYACFPPTNPPDQVPDPVPEGRIRMAVAAPAATAAAVSWSKRACNFSMHGTEAGPWHA